MTPIDRFERQLPTALTDLADPRTPDYLVDILGQTARTRQRPAWANPGRWNPMSGLRGRPALLTAIAAVLILVVGGAFLVSRRDQPAVGDPTASPSTPSSAVPSAGASGAVVSPGSTPKPGPIPAAIVGTWIAPVREVGGMDQSATSSIRFDDLKDDPQAPGFNIDLGAQSFGQEARADEVEPGVLRFVSRSSPGGCLDKDVGRYRWSMPSADHLKLELISDQCPNRSAITPGDWIRSGVGESDGGPGIAADFTPFFEFTLPAGTYRGYGNMHDAVRLDGSDGSTFKAWKDIDGFVDPCDDQKGRIDLEPGVDPFVAYLSSSDGLTVTDTKDTTIDGHPAIQVELTTKAGLDPAGCADGGVLIGVPNRWTSGDVALGIGETDTFIVTEVDGATIVFEVLDGSGAVLQDVVDSIRFIDALPT